ncbi:hypothetical protein RD792_003959 [Penstemon davidsonii]|uniref:DNA-directed RNA polymerase n=1 Tax=Penstemon davidsonii TaxID=160366 RepID=A0ABR0DGY3_9LAMI|nr:hypothetical protein RD792_003959 [Penstemon davidsonii]
MVIGTANEVSDAALGLPTINAPECVTCGAKSSKDGAKVSKDCEGHYGLINLPFTILNPYFMSEVAQILNKICPGCKSFRHNKKANSASSQNQPKNCRYCIGRYKDGYPKMKFKVSSKDVFAKTAIIAEVDEKSLNKGSHRVLASDYWDIITEDSTDEGSVLQSNKRVLLPGQVTLPITLSVCVDLLMFSAFLLLLVSVSRHIFAGFEILSQFCHIYERC